MKEERDHNTCLFFITRKGRNAKSERERQRQRFRTRTQDCNIWHHMLTYVVILYSETQLVLSAQRPSPKRFLLWLPTSPDWPPILRWLKLHAYIIFITLIRSFRFVIHFRCSFCLYRCTTWLRNPKLTGLSKIYMKHPLHINRQPSEICWPVHSHR